MILKRDPPIREGLTSKLEQQQKSAAVTAHFHEVLHMFAVICFLF